MKFLFGFLFGAITVAGVGYSFIDIRLALNTTEMLDYCDAQLPRNQNCLLLAMPESMMPGGGIPFENQPPLGNPSQGGFPLLFPPQIQKDDSGVR